MRALLVILLGAFIAHSAHRSADSQRARAVEDELLFLPSGDMMRVAGMGYHITIADALWFRTVLMFGERWGNEQDDAWIEWFQGMVVAINALDQRWRTPYFYGGSLLRVLGASEGSTKIFLAGCDAFPEDYYFPFAVGMNYYLFEEDTEAAAKWLEIAVEKPGAPKWYAAAAKGFLIERKSRPVAIRFLREEMESASDPRVRTLLEQRLKGLMHDEFSERLTSWRERFELDQGRQMPGVEALVQANYLDALPEDPYGAGWVADSDGDVVSSSIQDERARRAKRQERNMLRNARSVEPR